jgi:Sulfotransferase family
MLRFALTSVDKALFFDPTRPLVFMHVPKSAGISIMRALVSALQPKSAVSAGFDRSLFGKLSNFRDFNEEVRKLIYIETNELPQRADLFGAHMSFSTLIRSFPDAQFLTTIREPISRLLSLWVYWRSHTDEQLAFWGAQWGECLRSSRNPLINFLNERKVACQTDNQLVRMLLWPHSLIPDDDFIKTEHDVFLVQEAISKLEQYFNLDLVENPELESNFAKWLARPFTLGRYNETGKVPQPLRTQLADELTSNAWLLLDARSRLDLALWRAVAINRVSQADICFLRREAIARTVSRLSVQMAM